MKTILMSALGLSPWMCARVTLGYGLILLAALTHLTAGRQGNCSHPLVPEHGGFRCEPSPCRGFPQKSSVRYFCEPGFALPPGRHGSRCSRGHWRPPPPACLPMKEGSIKYEEANLPTPSVATTAVGVSIFLLTTTACMVIKSRLCPCHSHRRWSSDTVDLMVDDVPVSLPSYEEAVLGSWGQRLPPCRGPTQLLLSHEVPGHDPPSPARNQPESRLIHPSNQSPEQAPPPYEEVQSHPSEGDFQASHVALSNDKDV